MPAGLAEFAGKAVLEALKDPLALACALGEHMTEPKPSVWFDEPVQAWDEDALQVDNSGIALDARTRMMYDEAHIFINGESYRAKGADARLMQSLADSRSLDARQLRKASVAALSLLADWHEAGWLHQVAVKS